MYLKCPVFCGHLAMKVASREDPPARGLSLHSGHFQNLLYEGSPEASGLLISTAPRGSHVVKFTVVTVLLNGGGHFIRISVCPDSAHFNASHFQKLIF